MPRAVVLGKRDPGLTVEEFQRRSGELLDLAPVDVPALSRHVVSLPNARGYSRGELACDFVHEFEFADAAGATAFARSAGLRDRLGHGLLDKRTLAVLVVDVVVQKAGAVPPGAMKSLDFVVARADLDRDAFRAYWRDVHGPIVCTMANLRRYEQLHVIESAHAAPAAPAWDGVAVTWFDDTDAMRRTAASAEYRATRADEPNFLAPGVPASVITSERVVFEAPHFPFVRTALEPAEPFAGEPARYDFARRHAVAVRTWDGRCVRLLGSYEDVRQVLNLRAVSSDRRDPRFPSFYATQRFRGVGDGRFPLVDMDPPGHTRYRRLVAGALSASAARRARPSIERITAEAIDAVVRAGSPCDLVPLFCREIPVLVVCDLLGFPPEDRLDFVGFAETLRLRDIDEPERLAALDAMNRYVERAVVEGPSGDRARASSEVVARLLEEHEAGRLDLAGVVSVIRTLYNGAINNTSNTFALSVAALLRFPEQRRLLVERAVDLGQAVDELLRWTSVVPAVPRLATGAFTVASVQVAPGDPLLLSLPAANHDPAVFAEPSRLRLDRPAGASMAFGWGIHKCPGQHLVREQLAVALPMLFERLPGLALAISAAELDAMPGRGHADIATMPVTW
jgi:uncharacterized protein (TIGR02118 family)